MYLVDTSVWIHALRPSGSREIQSQLRPLIAADTLCVTDWILLELITGLSRSEDKATLLQKFAPIRRVSFDSAWWERAWENAARLRRGGVSPTAADCFIATVAIEIEASLIHCDRDFENMKRVLPLETLDWSLHLR